MLFSWLLTNRPRSIQKLFESDHATVVPCILLLWTCLNSPLHYKCIHLSIPLKSTGSSLTAAWNNTDEGSITLNNQVPETQNETIKDSIEVLNIPETSTVVPEIVQESAESNSKIKTISLQEAMENKLRILGKLLQQPITISIYLGVCNPVEYLKGSGHNREKWHLHSALHNLLSLIEREINIRARFRARFPTSSCFSIHPTLHAKPV